MSARKNSSSARVAVDKMAAAVSLLAFFAVVAAGLMGGVGPVTIGFRAFVAVLLIRLAAWVIVRLLASVEEIHGGKA